MEDAVIEALKSSPALMASVIMVYLFLRHLKVTTENHVAATKELMLLNNQIAKERNELFTATITNIHSEHMLARAKDHDVLEKHASSTLKLSETMAEVKMALHDCAEYRRR